MKRGSAYLTQAEKEKEEEVEEDEEEDEELTLTLEEEEELEDEEVGNQCVRDKNMSKGLNTLLDTYVQFVPFTE